MSRLRCKGGASRPWMAGLMLATAAAITSAPASALDYQLHGYASQGYVLSSGNNVFGNSTSGSINYYEAGANARLRLLPGLSVAAQGAIRDAGATDNGVPRLDYYFADYRALSSVHYSGGLRVGKVKNTIGLFNDTRDVIFTRPGILMPSVYSDQQGTRALLFAALGAQAYAEAIIGNHDISLTGTLSRNRGLSESQKQLLITLGGLPFDLHVSHSWNAQLLDSIDNGRWQLGFSHFYARMVLATEPTVSLFGSFDIATDFFSVRYNGEKFSVTAEYAPNLNRDVATLGGAPYIISRTISDSGYLQADYRIASNWNLMARMDAAFRNQSDRNGHKFADATGGDPFSQFAYDFTVGGNWRYRDHWGVWMEHHWINGTGTVLTGQLDNAGRIPNDHWSLFMLMVGYKF